VDQVSFQIIDTKMHGADGVTGAFLVEGRQRALIEAGPGSSLVATLSGLEDHGAASLDWIIVTHIHLDHAGAAGDLIERFPGARVAVHEIGAPHLVDPTKLWSSAARIYGDNMVKLWGRMKPVPEDRIHVLKDGDTIDLGGRVLRAVETPGHAKHHHAILDESSGVLFTGDAMGVRLPDVGIVRPATPPPEFDLEDAVASIERIRRLAPARLCWTHYGPSDEGTSPLDIEAACDTSIEALRQWGELVTAARAGGLELDDAAAQVRGKVEASLGDALDPPGIARMEHTTSYWMNTWGYMRYFDKTAKAPR
jgi:glyoxylase-like metal-dependent hydrolase (beta-lactamase superfamily II)